MDQSLCVEYRSVLDLHRTARLSRSVIRIPKDYSRILCPAESYATVGNCQVLHASTRSCRQFYGVAFSRDLRISFIVSCLNRLSWTALFSNSEMHGC